MRDGGIVTVRCDGEGCHKTIEIDLVDSFGDLEDHIASVNWEYDEEHGRDLCPACAKRWHRAKERHESMLDSITGVYHVFCDVCDKERVLDVGKAADERQVMEAMAMAGYVESPDGSVICEDCRTMAVARKYMKPLFELEPAA
jgi:hypothetical protein